MRHRSVRIGLAVVAVLACIAAGYEVVRVEAAVGRLTTNARAFVQRVQDVTTQTAAIKAAERAYIAPGQGSGFWMRYATTLFQAVDQNLQELSHSQTSPAAAAALASASAAAGQLANMDARVRQALRIGDQMLASDTIFSEGEQDTANLTRQVGIAGTRQRAQSDGQIASLRREEALAVVAAVLFTLGVLIALVRDPDRKSLREEELLGPALVLEPDAQQAATTEAGHFEDLRFDGVTAGGEPALPPLAPPDLAAAAVLCEEIARVDSPTALPMLLERVAALLDATGAVLWSATPGGDLRLALAHGYPPETVARMTAIPRDANNITAGALRTNALQVAPGDTVTNGALAVPLPGPAGPTGVLTTEMRHNGEADPARRALAAIIAAQFATVISPGVRGAEDWTLRTGPDKPQGPEAGGGEEDPGAEQATRNEE